MTCIKQILRGFSLFSYLLINFKQFFNRINAINSFILFLLLFFPAKIEAYSRFDIEHSLHVHTQHKDFEFYMIKSYLLNAGSLVSESLGLPFAKDCRIFLKNNYKKEIKVIKNKTDAFNIYLNNSYSFITKSRNVSHILLETFTFSTLKLPYSKENTRKIAWFVRALNRKLNKLISPAIHPGSGSFSGMHALLLFDYKLQPDIIINNPVSSSERVVYAINSEADEVLLDSILSMKSGKKMLVEYFKSVCEDNAKNNMNIFYSVLAKNLSLSKKECKTFFIKHLNDIAFKLAINSFMPASVKYTVKAFQTACIVSYITKDDSNTVKKCSLENLPIVWNSIYSSAELIKKLETDFVRISSFSPFFLQQPINGIIKSLRKFKEQKETDTFKQSVLLYKKEFKEAAVKQIEVQQLLREKEKKHVRVPARYDRYFQAIDTDNKNLNELWPKLNTYLVDEFKFGD